MLLDKELGVYQEREVTRAYLGIVKRQHPRCKFCDKQYEPARLTAHVAMCKKNPINLTEKAKDDSAAAAAAVGPGQPPKAPRFDNVHEELASKAATKHRAQRAMHQTALVALAASLSGLPLKAPRGQVQAVREEAEAALKGVDDERAVLIGAKWGLAPLIHR